MNGVETSLRVIIQRLGLIAGPIGALVLYLLLPESYENQDGDVVAFIAAGRATLAVMAWMGTWWLTEAIDISATALLPLVVFPLLHIADAKAAASPYASDIIFLFMGGFLLALSMQRWGLDKRIAFIVLQMVGTKPVNMIAGFMFVTAMLSAFVSNTATAAMLLPIAVSVIALVERQTNGASTIDQADGSKNPVTNNFALCLLLGIAYSASIGGIATIIGTPPNGILVQFIAKQIAEEYRKDISFVQWLSIGLPVALVMLPLTWFMLTRIIYPVRIKKIEGGRSLIRQQLRALGPASRGEWTTFLVFLCTALLWMLRPLIVQIQISGSGVRDWLPFAGLRDSTIAMLGGLLLFVIPVNWKTREFAMNWHTAERLPWGILILFGGGLSLAAAVKANGVGEFIGSLTQGMAGAPVIIVILGITAMMIFLTELTSNTATTATLVPILAALAPGLGAHPYLLIIPAAIAASCAFMMPVATPPNAIVFGSGHVTIPQMCKAGLWLNLVGIVVVTLVAMVMVKSVFAM